MHEITMATVALLCFAAGLVLIDWPGVLSAINAPRLIVWALVIGKYSVFISAFYFCFSLFLPEYAAVICASFLIAGFLAKMSKEEKAAIWPDDIMVIVGSKFRRFSESHPEAVDRLDV